MKMYRSTITVDDEIVNVYWHETILDAKRRVYKSATNSAASRDLGGYVEQMDVTLKRAVLVRAFNGDAFKLRSKRVWTYSPKLPTPAEEVEVTL